MPTVNKIITETAEILNETAPIVMAMGAEMSRHRIHQIPLLSDMMAAAPLMIYHGVRAVEILTSGTELSFVGMVSELAACYFCFESLGWAGRMVIPIIWEDQGSHVSVIGFKIHQIAEEVIATFNGEPVTDEAFAAINERFNELALLRRELLEGREGLAITTLNNLLAVADELDQAIDCRFNLEKACGEATEEVA